MVRVTGRAAGRASRGTPPGSRTARSVRRRPAGWADRPVRPAGPRPAAADSGRRGARRRPRAPGRPDRPPPASAPRSATAPGRRVGPGAARGRAGPRAGPRSVGARRTSQGGEGPFVGAAPLDVAGEDLAGDAGEGAGRPPQVQAARPRHGPRPVLGHRGAEGAREGTGHRGDRVAVAAVVDRTEHRLPVVAAGDHQHAECDGQFLDGVQPGGAAGGEGGGAVVRADRVVRGDRRAQRPERRLELVVPAGRFADLLDRRPGAVLGRGQAGGHHRVRGRVRRGGGGDGRGEDTGRLPAVRRLVGTGDVQRFGVRGARVGRVDQADGGHVHRRTAVDDVADARLPGVRVPVGEPGHEPLLGEEQPVQRQCLRLQFGDPAGLGHQVRHQVLGQRVGVEVVADPVVDPDQRVGHQGVVGDVAVALVVRRQGAGGAPGVAVPGADDAAHPAAVPFGDLLGGVPLDGSAEGVTDGGADEGAGDPLVQSGRAEPGALLFGAFELHGRHARIILLGGPVVRLPGVRRVPPGRCR
ncbi:hypothetical protein SGPA1_31320 [Streptomyces misionensis JCM 4497]